MSLPALHAFLDWLIEELVDALLRPLFCAMREAERSGDAARAETLGHRFFHLFNFCDCWPCRVTVDEHQLFVSRRGSVDFGFDDEDWGAHAEAA